MDAVLLGMVLLGIVISIGMMKSMNMYKNLFLYFPDATISPKENFLVPALQTIRGTLAAGSDSFEDMKSMNTLNVASRREDPPEKGKGRVLRTPTLAERRRARELAAKKAMTAFAEDLAQKKAMQNAKETFVNPQRNMFAGEVVKEAFQVVPIPQDVPGAHPIKLQTGYRSYDLLEENGLPERRIAAGPTSQHCFLMDYARNFERAGSYAQRTNNYKRGYPDSCSAPNHDLVLDFYKAKPAKKPIIL